MFLQRILVPLASTVGSFLLAAAPSLAQPVQIVVPYAPGGSADTIGRLIADQYGRQTSRQVVIVNQPGAGSQLGSTFVSKAKPDGNTLLFQTPAVTILQTLKKAPGFDVRKDLVAITQAVESAMGVYVNPTLPIRNIRELISYAKQNPGKLNYSSSGIGSSAHLYTELLKESAGIAIEHVPYSGGAGYTMAVASNQAQLVIADSLGGPRGLAASGRLRMIAVGSAKRSAAFPDVPTVAESGVPGYEVAYWIGFFAPAGTPGDIVTKLHADLTQAINTPALRQQLEGQGYRVVGGTSDEFRRFVATEVGRWERLVQAAGIPRE